jgi:hypothetical protein
MSTNAAIGNAEVLCVYRCVAVLTIFLLIGSGTSPKSTPNATDAKMRNPEKSCRGALLP